MSADIPETSVVSDVNPLESSWSLWYDKKLSPATNTGAVGGSAVAPTGAGSVNGGVAVVGGVNQYKSYEQNLHRLGTFDSLEGFWQHYSYINEPEELPKDHNVFLFRNTLIPAWETFPQGGCWIVKVRKHNGVINRLWEELCFSLVGEWFGEPDVVGIGLSTRSRDDNVSVWHVDASKEAVKLAIGEKLKEILNLDESTQVEYKYFKSAMIDGSSFRNAKAYMYAANTVPGAMMNMNMVNAGAGHIGMPMNMNMAMNVPHYAQWNYNNAATHNMQIQ